MIKEKRIALVGAGFRCRELLKDYSDGNICIHIVAIMDNSSSKWGEKLSNISIMPLQNLKRYEVQEYWITSINYAEELKRDLCDKHGIEEKDIKIISDINTFLYYRIREKYKDFIEGKKKCLNPDMNEVIDYMKDNLPRMFCYHFVDDYLQRKVDIARDYSSGMFYVIHNGKKLFFSERYCEEEVKELYNCLCMEQDERSPHKYLGADFQLYEGDIVADIGAAEGMFVLDNIDKIKFAYLFESDTNWIKALNKTFVPYAKKIQIVDRYVSDVTSERKIKIDDFFNDKKVDFIKMDIEGEELPAIYGSERVLKRDNPRAVICTYHNKDDYDKVAEYSSKLGYKITHSKGVILCVGPWERGNPDLDFRKGVIRLEKI